MTKAKAFLGLFSNIVFYFILISFFVFSLFFFSFHLLYSRNIIPGVNVAGKINLSGRSVADAQKILEEKVSLLTGQKLVLSLREATSGGEKVVRYDLPFSQVGVAFDVASTGEKAYLVGRSGSLPEDLKNEIQALRTGKTVPLEYQIDEEKLNGFVAVVGKDWNEPPKNAAFSLAGGKLTINPSRTGVIVDAGYVGGVIRQMINELELSKDLRLELVTPAISATDLETVKPELEMILTNPPTVSGLGQRWPLTPESVLALINFEKNSEGWMALRVDREKVSQLVADFSSQLNISPRGQIIEVSGARVVKFVPQRTGYEVDRFEGATLISRALLQASPSAVVALPLRELPAPKTTNSYGITDLLGEGKTNFAGSIPGRIHNLTLASSRINGILVPPGDIFSFNNAVGEVTAAAGYDEAYIISEGRTVLGTGGGLCQVSSTIFRAALNAGLPIVKRTAHAYRVHYYEPPVGFDATVYGPSVDFQFRNDTKNYLLVTNEIVGEDLYFRFYGTNDGRQVAIKGPFISREVAPPAPLYQEDASVASGQTVQVDWSAWGADAVFYRTVRRGGEVLQNDTFQSHYQAWRAVFLVGKKV